MPYRTALLTIALATASMASATPRQDWFATCGQWRELTAGIMRARQNGVPMRSEQKALKDQPAQGTVSALIGKAYDEPVFATPKMKTKAIHDFSQSVYSVCQGQNQKD